MARLPKGTMPEGRTDGYWHLRMPVQILLTEDMYLKLTGDADAAGLTISEYARRKLGLATKKRSNAW